MADDKTIGNTPSQIARLYNANLHQKTLADKRNATPVYAFIWGDKRHRELWGLSQLENTTMSFIRKNDKGESIKTRESVYVGKLSTAIQELKVNQRGETKRGDIRPIAFWFITKTGEFDTFGSATQEERDYVAVYVGGLMKKFLFGVAMIERNEYSACKGFDKRNDKSKEHDEFNRAYLNKKSATDEEITIANEKTAKATQSVTPVNMD